MAFGLDDLTNFVEGLRRTFKGSAEPTRAQQNIRSGVVNPLRMGAEVSGVNQAYRGARPDASNMDRGLALLVMAGMLGGVGAADEIGKAGGKVARGGKNKFLDVFGEKATMYHGSPQSGLNKLVPNIARDAGSPKPYVYLSPQDRVVGNMPQYLAPGHRVPMNQMLSGSVYQTRVPVHRLEEYSLAGLSRPHWARRTSVPVKITDEIKFSNQNMSQINDALEKWIKNQK